MIDRCNLSNHCRPKTSDVCKEFGGGGFCQVGASSYLRSRQGRRKWTKSIVPSLVVTTSLAPVGKKMKTHPRIEFSFASSHLRWLSRCRISATAPSLHAGDQAIPTSPLESSLPIGRKIVSSSLTLQTVTHVVASSLLGMVMRNCLGGKHGWTIAWRNLGCSLSLDNPGHGCSRVVPRLDTQGGPGSRVVSKMRAAARSL